VTRGQGRGRGKLLLFGEHAAVYGYPAVGATLQDSTRVELALDGSGRYRFPESAAADRERLEALFERFSAILPALGGLAGGEVRISSSIPIGLGFGSSAALCAAAAAALQAALPEAGADPQTAWRWAHEAERLFHGTPSGIDTGLALREGLYLFTFGAKGLPSARRLRAPGLNLVVGAVPRGRGGGLSIGSLRQRVQAGEPAVAAALRELGALAQQAAGQLEGEPGRSLPEVGRLAWRAQEILAGLGLGTPGLEALLAEGRKRGALGGKMSGAGDGGAFFLLYSDRDAALAAAEALRRVVPPRELASAVRAIEWKEERNGQSES
jgi:mevalonate kinase